jgi:hypothetical protein
LSHDRKMKVSRAIVCPDRRPGSEKAVLIGMRWEQNVQRNGRLNEDVTNGEPCGRADLSALPALSQAGGFDQVDAKAAALITASAEHWTSQATCLSDSRSLSAPAVARGLAEHSLTFSHTPAPVAAIPPPSLPCPPIRQCSKSASVADTTRLHADTRRTGTVSFHHG